jgi:hypothetical protein
MLCYTYLHSALLNIAIATGVKSKIAQSSAVFQQQFSSVHLTWALCKLGFAKQTLTTRKGTVDVNKPAITIHTLGSVPGLHTLGKPPHDCRLNKL